MMKCEQLEQIALRFFVDVPDGWTVDVLQLSVRLRGLLGYALKHQCCIYDAAVAECAGCNYRQQCHYGLSFESTGPVEIPGFGKIGSLPHAWSLKVDLIGLRVRCELLLIGVECQNVDSWVQVVEALPMPIHWLYPAVEGGNFSLLWDSLTPVRLRFQGKNPREHQVAAALSASVARKGRLLALLHEMDAPSSRLPEPVCTRLQWVEGERYSFRRQELQPMGGWMMRVEWPETVAAEWIPWLGLIRLLGVGRQTTFGFGRMGCIENK